jgi:hypothetical protein
VTEQESIKKKRGEEIRDCSFGDIHGCIKYLPYERVCTLLGGKQDTCEHVFYSVLGANLAEGVVSEWYSRTSMDTSTYQKTSFIKHQIAKPKRNMCRREVLESLYIYLSCKITTLCCVARCPSGYRLCHAMRALSTNRRRPHAQTNSSRKPRICKVIKYFHALYAKPLKWFER